MSICPFSSRTHLQQMHAGPGVLHQTLWFHMWINTVDLEGLVHLGVLHSFWPLHSSMPLSVELPEWCGGSWSRHPFRAEHSMASHSWQNVQFWASVLIYIWVFNLILLINMSVFVAITSFYGDGSIVHLEIRDVDTFRSFLVFRIVLAIMVHFFFLASFVVNDDRTFIIWMSLMGI